MIIYIYLNNYLRDGSVMKFSEKELRSWAYYLHSSLQFRTSNVSNGTVVYMGISLHASSNWKVGSRFYFENLFQPLSKLMLQKNLQMEEHY